MKCIKNNNYKSLNILKNIYTYTVYTVYSIDSKYSVYMFPLKGCSRYGCRPATWTR